MAGVYGFHGESPQVHSYEDLKQHLAIAVVDLVGRQVAVGVLDLTVERVHPRIGHRVRQQATIDGGGEIAKTRPVISVGGPPTFQLRAQWFEAVLLNELVELELAAGRVAGALARPIPTQAGAALYIHRAVQPSGTCPPIPWPPIPSCIVRGRAPAVSNGQAHYLSGGHPTAPAHYHDPGRTRQERYNVLTIEAPPIGQPDRPPGTPLHPDV